MSSRLPAFPALVVGGSVTFLDFPDLISEVIGPVLSFETGLAVDGVTAVGAAIVEDFVGYHRCTHVTST